jgi:hypothetical protein
LYPLSLCGSFPNFFSQKPQPHFLLPKTNNFFV